MAEVRVRFAPSPTGYLHIGSARTALFNYLFAKRYNGKFILRIEDTDAERTIEDSTEKMMEMLRWLGLSWDEGPEVGGIAGPYHQSQRLEMYRKYAKMLIDKGFAYKCYCTREELAEERERAKLDKKAYKYSRKCRDLMPEERECCEKDGRACVVRFMVPETGSTVVHDLIHDEVSFRNEDIGDFIIMKSDGVPTYNFACVVDDWLMGITHVLRADEHLSNTPKQILIFRALSAPVPKFAHVPMILAPDRSKLSKRHGAQTVEEFREKGYLPEAIINYLAFLGWTPPDSSKEILKLEEMQDIFDLSNVSSTPAVYDVAKLTWMNGQYIKKMEPKELVRKYVDYAIKSGLASREFLMERIEWVHNIVESLRDRIKTVVEMVEASEYFYIAPTGYDQKGEMKYFSKPGIDDLLEKGAGVLSQIDEWSLESCEKAYRELISKESIKSGELIHPTRLALTGKTIGPGLFEVIYILGRDESVSRLKAAVKYIKKNF